MLRLRSFLSAVLPVLATASVASAVISVNTNVVVQDGIRAQAVITEASGFGSGITAVAIKEIHSAIFVVDEDISRVPEGGSPGLAVNKRQLTAREAYGAGDPLGYEGPPLTDPSGPWFGLVWPFRDPYDYFPGPFERLGDDVGTAFTISPNVYGFVDVDGVQRGGPTDPEPAGGDISRLQRGLTGNGLTGPATYFAFDVNVLSGPADRFITIRQLSTTARVVVRNDAGQFSEILVDVPDSEIRIQLPEPLAASWLAGLTVLARRRR